MVGQEYECDEREHRREDQLPPVAHAGQCNPRVVPYGGRESRQLSQIALPRTMAMKIVNNQSIGRRDSTT